MIVVTGAAGFIGSNLLRRLNDEGHTKIVIVDDFSNKDKDHNYFGKTVALQIDRNEFIDGLDKNHSSIDYIFHIGARTDTAEFDVNVFNNLNLGYSQKLWQKCVQYQIPFIYASSAATYGMGEHGYDDSHEIVEKLKPLNPYGDSKNDFDKWVLQQSSTPPFWAGIKFFNVYGPNEYHKDRMASVIFHAFKQIKQTGKMKLFRSHNPDYKDGEQTRDFIYVKDVIDVLYFFYSGKHKSGLYNLGTGKARKFLDLVKGTFAAMDIKEDIEFIDTPKDIRDKYQYFTEANMDKLRSIGYKKPFHELEEGINDYVRNYLQKSRYQ